MRRVAVTGMGLVTPLGHDAAQVFAAARSGQSAVARLNFPFASRLASPVGAAVGFDGGEHFEPPKLRMLDRVSQFALLAANRALADAASHLTRQQRCRAGVFVGTGMGGIGSIDDGYQTLYGEQSDRIKPFMILLGMHHAPAAWIGIEHGFTGPNLTFSTACSSSAVSIGEAWMRLARGDIDMAVAGGAEAPLVLGSMKAWEALRTIATPDASDASTSCKPFSADRSGMVLGEGAAMLVLEPWDSAVARGVFIHGEITGYGLVTDTGHITRPSVEGQAAALRAALQSAGLDASEIDAINAHGTGTAANDSTETEALKSVFGKRAAQIPISATKAMHGHLLGATSALEVALSLLQMQYSVALPTLHLQRADPLCDLDYVPNAAREGVPMRNMLSSSFAFGGTHAVLALRAAS